MATLKEPIISRQPKLEILEDRLPLSTFTVVNDLSQGPGSLNQAAIDAKANPGPDRIEFNIPGDGPFRINPGEQNKSFLFGDDLTIDGFSQPGSSPNNLKIGSNAVIKIAITDFMDRMPSRQSFLFGDNCQIQGLLISSWFQVGNNCTFKGNYVGVDFNGIDALFSNGFSCLSNCLIGGSEPKDRNIISNLATSLNNNQISGNYFGLSADGLNAIDRKGKWPAEGILIQSNHNIIGGILPGQGNVISGYDKGVLINGEYSCSSDPTEIPGTYTVPFSPITEPSKTYYRHNITGNDNQIQGNYLGTNGYGTAESGSLLFTDRSAKVRSLSNDQAISLNSGVNNLIGGLTTGSRNIISNNVTGIYMPTASSCANKIQGNFIGCDVNGSQLGNMTGIYIFNASINNVIGGPEEGAGNVIAYNSTFGINIEGEGSIGNLIDPNIVHGNKNIGIDLGGNGRTTNGVPGRPGPNGNQNYPVISKAKYQVVKGVKYVVITGSLHGIKNTVHRLEFFSNATTRAVDAQGQFFLGFAYVKTNATGKSNFSLRFKFQPGRFITSTATDWVLKNTSEFSPAVLRT